MNDTVQSFVDDIRRLLDAPEDFIAALRSIDIEVFESYDRSSPLVDLVSAGH